MTIEQMASHRVVADMSVEEQEARSIKHQPKGIRVIPLRSGRVILVDGWNRLIPRVATPYSANALNEARASTEFDFGFTLNELPLVIPHLFAEWDFSIPASWGHHGTHFSASKGASPESVTSSSAEDLGL